MIAIIVWLTRLFSPTKILMPMGDMEAIKRYLLNPVDSRFKDILSVSSQNFMMRNSKSRFL